MSVSHIGEGLSSCAHVPGLLSMTSLRSLCLHGNNITRIEAIQQLHGLQDLNLSSNCITSIENLGGLSSLTSINLASNRLMHVTGLDGLASLTSLNLSYNGLTSISGLTALHGPHCKLKSLDLRHNQLESLQAFSVLVGCINLRDLSIAGNPVTSVPNHQQVGLPSKKLWTNERSNGGQEVVVLNVIQKSILQSSSQTCMRRYC